MTRGLVRIPVLAALIVWSAGCVGNVAYRTCFDQPATKCHKPSVLSEELMTEEFDRTQTGAQKDKWPYQLAFIEFDDRGEMFDRQQLDAAVQTIVAAKKSAPPGTRPVIALFVHGWKNNASEDSGNVWGFRQMLAGLALQYKVPNGGPQAPVVGIYIGWRGAVISAPILKEFTFFDRHGKSQNLPGAHLSEALIRVMEAAKGRGFNDTSTISVLIGHSFGGAVLETALSETLAQTVLQARQSGTPIRWPADLIMFLNEAQEATRSYQLIESLMANVTERPRCQAPGQPQPQHAPAVVSVSSTGDTATRVAFSAAQSLNRPFNSLRRYPDGGNALGIKSQTSMFFRTTAHMGEFQSHIVKLADDPEIAELLKTCQPTLRFTATGRVSDPRVPDPESRYVLLEKPGTLNRTPYWVFHIPPDLVPDHSTIFTPVFRQFLISLVEWRQQLSPHDEARPSPQ